MTGEAVGELLVGAATGLAVGGAGTAMAKTLDSVLANSPPWWMTAPF